MQGGVMCDEMGMVVRIVVMQDRRPRPVNM